MTSKSGTALINGTSPPTVPAAGQSSHHSAVDSEDVPLDDARSLAADDDSTEVDEGYATSTSTSYLTSIASDVRKGVLENGRIYPDYGKNQYGLPMDEAELDRNDLQHSKFMMLLDGRLHAAPIANAPQEILDLGTGTGIWAIDMADAYPSARVVGVDLIPTQPAWVPTNCHFEIEDVEDDWTRRTNSFDYIHGRELLLAIRDWKKLLDQSFAHLKPGGFLELGGTVPQPGSDDGTLSLGPTYLEIGELLLEMSEKMQTSILEPLSWKQKMEAAGFTNVKQYNHKVPLGPWPKHKRLKKIGAIELVHVPEALEPCILRGFTQVLGGDLNHLQVMLTRVRNEIKNPKMHSYVW